MKKDFFLVMVLVLLISFFGERTVLASDEKPPEGGERDVYGHEILVEKK